MPPGKSGKAAEQDNLRKVWQQQKLKPLITLLEFTKLCGEVLYNDSYHYIKQSHTPTAEAKKIIGITSQILGDKPLALIRGYTEFMGVRIELKHKVLIPRPETEGLVTIAVKLAQQLYQRQSQPVKLLEVGVGSGAIICSLSKILANSQILFVFKGIDISTAAVKNTVYNIARIFTSNHSHSAFISIYRIPLLKYMYAPEAKDVDIIISNPPYLDASDITRVDNNIAIYEPRAALTAGKDTFKLYKQLFSHFQSSNATYLVCELPANHIEEIRKLLDRAKVSNYQIQRDLYGRYRYLICSK